MNAGTSSGVGAPVVPADPDRLRIALLVYRGNPHSGGQGVYTRYLSRALVEAGHEVTVLSGQPWPVLDPGVDLVKVPSLDLYRQPDPFRFPKLSEFRDGVDIAEVAVMLSAGFPEPLTFSLRARRLLSSMRSRFDVVQDNGSFGTGLLGLVEDGWPVLGTCHHPITIDRQLDLEHAATFLRRTSLRRWYGFVRMQKRVAQQMERIVTVSESSRSDIVEQMGVSPDRLAIVPIGADLDLFKPLEGSRRVPGRIMTTASADVPLKGLVYLLEALAKLRVEQPDAHLVVVGAPKQGGVAAEAIERLSLGGAVSWQQAVSDEELVRLYSEASVAVVPSLYEGFSLPAVEAMASEVPVVATTGGALPEVVGSDGDAGLLVPPGDPGALAHAIGTVLEDAALAQVLGKRGRRRVMEKFTWRVCAEGTVDHYRWLIERASSGSIS